MHPIEMRDSENINIIDIVYKDILSETTRKIRRKLLLVSFITLFVVLDEITIKSFMGLGVNQSVTPEQITSIVESALSVIILYLIITFGVFVRVDHQQWNTAKDLTKIMNVHRLLGDINYKMNDIIHRISLYENREADWKTRVDDGTIHPVLENHKDDLSKLIKDYFYHTVDGEKVIKEEVKRLKVDQSDINEIFSAYKNLTSDHKFKYWLVDLGVPVVFSIIAFSKVWSGLLLFWGNL